MKKTSKKAGQKPISIVVRVETESELETDPDAALRHGPIPCSGLDCLSPWRALIGAEMGETGTFTNPWQYSCLHQMGGFSRQFKPFRGEIRRGQEPGCFTASRRQDYYKTPCRQSEHDALNTSTCERGSVFLLFSSSLSAPSSPRFGLWETHFSIIRDYRNRRSSTIVSQRGAFTNPEQGANSERSY
jgi:hypothetical protein